MGSYRDRLQIIADILSTVGSGAKKTKIMYQANLSYRLLCRYLDEVIDAGLVKFEDDSSYVLTTKGKEFLSRHEEYAKRCKTFEAQFNHVAETKTSLEKMCSGNPTSAGSMNKAYKKTTISDPIPTTLKGVVLAAGEGTRIREVTYGAFPKELLPIGNVPTIRFPIEALRLSGIDDILVVIAPQTKHGIVDGLQSGERFGVDISYVVQERNKKSPWGLGPAVLSTRPRIHDNEDLVVVCGDSILCNFSQVNPLDCLKPLVDVHKLTGALATVMVHPTKSDPRRFGVVKFRSFHEENKVLYGDLERLVEKPSLETAKTFSLNGYNYIAVGYYAFKPKIFSYIEKTEPGARNEVQITDAMALALAEGERICGVVHGRVNGKEVVPCGYWDVGIPEDYKEANMRLLDMNLDKLLS